MSKNVLVATHHTAFGELLRLSLEEGGSYRVRIAQNAHEALSNIRKQAFELAIVDYELPGESLDTVIMSLREQSVFIKVVLIPPDNDPQHPLVTELGVDGCLSRPFYLPSMLKMVQRLLEEPAMQNSQPNGLRTSPNQLGLENKPWLTDSSLLTQRLSYFLNDSLAQAALVTQMDQLLVYIGSITPQDAHELCEILSRYWNKSETYDLARFVRLSSDNNEVLLYAKTIEPGLGLALVHNTKMPISKVRAEINRLAELLISPPSERMIYPPPAVEDILPPIPPAETISPYFGVQAQSSDQPAGEYDYDTLLNLAPPAEQGADESFPSEAFSTLAETQTAAPAKSAAPPADENEPTLQPVELQTATEEALSLQSLMEETAAPASENEPTLQPVVLQTAPEEEALSFQTLAEENIIEPSLEPEEELSAPLMGGDWAPESDWQSVPVSLAQNEPSDNGLNAQDLPLSHSQTSPLQSEAVLSGDIPTEPDYTDLQPLSASDDFIEAETLNLHELLTSMPSPDPEQALQKEASNHQTSAAVAPEEIPVTFPWEEHETLPFESGYKSITHPMVSTDTIPSTPHPARAASYNSELSSTQEPFSLDETRPSIGDHASSYLDPLPSPPVQSDQVYTCLLLTRLPGNKLRGQLGKQLKEWLPEMCIAFGWNLDGMAIRPEYIQWTTRLAPAISPANLVRIVRKNTSEKIFSQHPGMRPIDGSDDFWAPGYLIIRGSQPPTQKALFEFIQLTRKRQGYLAG